MTVTAKITSKGQIALPKKVRDLLHLREGGVVVFEQEGDKIVIKSAQSLLDYKGYLRGRARPTLYRDGTIDFVDAWIVAFAKATGVPFAPSTPSTGSISTTLRESK